MPPRMSLRDSICGINLSKTTSNRFGTTGPSGAPQKVPVWLRHRFFSCNSPCGWRPDQWDRIFPSYVSCSYDAHRHQSRLSRPQWRTRCSWSNMSENWMLLGGTINKAILVADKWRAGKKMKTVFSFSPTFHFSRKQKFACFSGFIFFSFCNSSSSISDSIHEYAHV